jgi:hypothetical protein
MCRKRSGQPGRQVPRPDRRRRLPLAAKAGPANRHDSTEFEAMLDAVPPIRTPARRRRKRPDKLHAARGATTRGAAAARHQAAHRPRRGGAEGAARPPPLGRRAHLRLAQALPPPRRPPRAPPGHPPGLPHADVLHLLLRLPPEGVVKRALSRLGRTLRAIVDAQDALARRDNAIRSGTEPFDTSTPTDTLIFQILTGALWTHDFRLPTALNHSSSRRA